MDVSSGDYYRQLQVPRTASRQEIKLAFRRLARKYHPDLHPNDPDAVMKFKALNQAYEVLIDRVQRQRYDQQVEVQSTNQRSAAPDDWSQANRVNEEAQNDGKPRSNAFSRRPPQSSTDFYLRGIHHTLAHRYSAALKDYTQAIALDPQFAEAFLRRAEVNSLLKRDSAVLADCGAAIALNDKEAKTYYYQGLARYRLGYVQSAIAAFTQAIACDSGDARYHRWRAIAHQDLHDLDDAATDFRRAADLYRAQGNLLDYRSVQQSLRSLGTAGLSWPKKLIVRSCQRVLSPLLRGCSNNRLGGNRLWGNRRGHASQFFSTDSSVNARAASNETPYRTSSSQNWVVPPRKENRTEERKRDGKEDTGTSEGAWSGPAGRPPSGDYHQHPDAHRRPAARERQNPLNPYVNPFRQERDWVQDYFAQPAPADSFFARLMVGAKTTLKLISNPGGEVVSTYRQIPIGKHSVVGYGLAVLANLCFVLGVSQFFSSHPFSSSSWLLASRLWATGAFTFVGMVLILSLVRLRLRNIGRWSADVFILGTALLPLGLFAVVLAIAPIIGSYLSSPMLSELIAPLILLGLGVCAVWAFAQSFIAIHSGLMYVQKIPHQLSAWLSPVILSFGLVTGITTWLLLAG